MIQPIRDNIVVRPCQSENISEGGIYVPDSYKKRPNKAIVVSVGKGIAGKPMLLKEGMTIYHVKDWGTECIDKGEKFYLMKDIDVLAIN